MQAWFADNPPDFSLTHRPRHRDQQPVREADRQRDRLLQLGDPVAAADHVQGQRERGGTGAHHIDIPRGLAPRAPERALCLPRRANHRP